MKTRVSLLAVVVAFLATGFGLGACQTTPPPAPAAATPPPAPTATPPPAPAAAPVPAEPAQPIAEDAARNLANNCFTCHGPAGHSPGSIPSLYTLGADDIAKRLRDFKNDVVPSTVMGRHAKGYTDAEIDAVAKYIAGLKN